MCCYIRQCICLRLCWSIWTSVGVWTWRFHLHAVGHTRQSRCPGVQATYGRNQDGSVLNECLLSTNGVIWSEDCAYWFTWWVLALLKHLFVGGETFMQIYASFLLVDFEWINDIVFNWVSSLPLISLCKRWKIIMQPIQMLKFYVILSLAKEVDFIGFLFQIVSVLLVIFEVNLWKNVIDH